MPSSRRIADFPSEMRLLPRAFYERDPIAVARDLLGKVLVHGACAARIVETEAYLDRNENGEIDLAAHSSRGITGRTRVIFGPPGHAYVYLIYGMYECLNIVTSPENVPGCVLVRALEPVAGVAAMRKRRPAAAKDDTKLCSGPGRLTQAMGITRAHSGVDLVAGPLTIRAPDVERDFEIAAGPRIGIRHCADWPLRFYIEGHPSVSG